MHLRHFPDAFIQTNLDVDFFLSVHGFPGNETYDHCYRQDQDNLEKKLRKKKGCVRHNQIKMSIQTLQIE